MVAKSFASTLIMSALALVGDYAAADQAVQRPVVSLERHAVKRTDLRRVVTELRQGWMELDVLYAEAIRVTLKREAFDAEKFEQLPSLINMTRGLEAALRGAVVPAELADEHMALRRAVAKTRGRLMMLYSLFRQVNETPSVFESDISAEGLSALAEHTTRKLAQVC